MWVISTTIEISAPPTVVREKFLDFSQIPTYHPNGFFRSLGPAKPDRPLEVGAVMHNVLEMGTFDPTILENSESCFRWVGTVPGLLSGEHSFHFEASKENPGHTTFAHQEKFSKALGFLMGESFLANMVGYRDKTLKGFERFNHDLKKWIESSQ
ncbi:hypothetical protein F5884DRAFT_780796 [Xylogone sp. PMI_703]|nr:hypothetical protein F5884DRAFT_780796 [Xylogone sp. PMI_703]